MRQDFSIVYCFCRYLFFLGFMRERGGFRGVFCAGTRKKFFKFFPQIYFFEPRNARKSRIFFQRNERKVFLWLRGSVRGFYSGFGI